MESFPTINLLLLLLLLVMNSITSQEAGANEESTTKTDAKVNLASTTETPQVPKDNGESAKATETESKLIPGNQTNSESQANQDNLKKPSMCKPNEVLTATKGCIDREAFMERVLLQAWMGESLDVDKHRIGLEAVIECKENEILTAFGCAPEKKPLRRADAPRARILHSVLYGKQVFTSDAGMPSSRNSKMRTKEILAWRDTEKSQPRSIDFTNDSSAKRKHHQSKPGSYVFLPGRRLSSLRKCRPYEVLARHDRCIRKLGLTGPYEHKDHIYGLKQ